MIQVSNNPYGSTLSTLGSRPRLDTGRLGIVSLEIRGDAEAASFLAALATGLPQRFKGLTILVGSVTFEVVSGITDRRRAGRRDTGDGPSTHVLDQIEGGCASAPVTRDRLFTGRAGDGLAIGDAEHLPGGAGQTGRPLIRCSRVDQRAWFGDTELVLAASQGSFDWTGELIHGLGSRRRCL